METGGVKRHVLFVEAIEKSARMEFWVCADQSMFFLEEEACSLFLWNIVIFL